MMHESGTPWHSSRRFGNRRCGSGGPERARPAFLVGGTASASAYLAYRARAGRANSCRSGASSSCRGSGGAVAPCAAIGVSHEEIHHR